MESKGKIDKKPLKCSPKGAKREPKPQKWSPKGAKREPKGAKREPNGAKRVPKGSQRANKMHLKIDVRKRSPKECQKGKRV